MYRINPDADIRALERQFRTAGDLASAEALFTARLRINALSASDIELLAVLGFPLAQQAFTGLGRKGKPKWNAKTLWQEQGQYRGFRLALAALRYTLNQTLAGPRFDPITQPALALLDGATPDGYNLLRDKSANKIFQKITRELGVMEKEIRQETDEDRWRTALEDRREIDEALAHGLVPDVEISTERDVPSALGGFTLLSQLVEIRNMLAPAKGNTFYKLGNNIMDTAIAEISKKQPGWTQEMSEEKASRRAAQIEKTAMAILYDAVILPEALRLILLTSSEAPAALSRGTDYYLNEIKAGRFSSISVTPPPECPVPKRVNELWPGDTYVKFTVWTSSKKEARNRAEQVLYKLFGYVPDFGIYPAGYKTAATEDVEVGHHEDALGMQPLSDDAINLQELFRGPSARAQGAHRLLDQQEAIVCQNIAKLRPDLY